MPRKPTVAKRKVTIVVEGRPIDVALHPPSGTRKSWYVYWRGLTTSRSTGHEGFEEAVKSVEAMLRDGGKKQRTGETDLSDEEFLKIQTVHFGRKTDQAAKVRAAKSLEECEDAILAFKAMSNLPAVSEATPDDCARFQRRALEMPRNWRRHYPKGKQTEDRISPNTVLKWSRMLQSAFERANRNAGKKCVRGVVDERKLLAGNPWTQFTWIDGCKGTIRQFDADELRSFLDFLRAKYSAVPVAAVAAKVLLWSCCRRLEVAGLTWDQVRLMDDEIHFEVVGKWGVERWFRIPGPVYEELLSFRIDAPFIFAAYCEQIRDLRAVNRGCVRKIRESYAPANFGRWIYERVKEWSATLASGRASVHAFRKTALQFVHDGEEDAAETVALDAGVSKSVLLKHYVRPKLWRKSNRTYARLLASLPADIARIYGYRESERERLERKLNTAKEAGRWSVVAEIAARLGALDGKSPLAG